MVICTKLMLYPKINLFSPITHEKATSTSTRNACHFNYTAIVKTESMKSELGNLFRENNMTIPPGFENLRHTVAGGTAGTLAANQDKVKNLMEDVPVSRRGRKRTLVTCCHCQF